MTNIIDESTINLKERQNKAAAIIQAMTKERASKDRGLMFEMELPAGTNITAAQITAAQITAAQRLKPYRESFIRYYDDAPLSENELLRMSPIPPSIGTRSLSSSSSPSSSPIHTLSPVKPSNTPQETNTPSSDDLQFVLEM